MYLQYRNLQNSNVDWFCKNCVSPCGIYKEGVYHTDPAIECDKCKTWFHNRCSLISDSEYLVIQAANCTWLCPECGESNLSSSFSSLTSDIEIRNQFECLSDSAKSNSTVKMPKTVKFQKLTFVSININEICGKKELQSFLVTENTAIVAIQETKIDSSVKTNELIPDALDYDIYRNLNGGGTMLIVKSHLNSAPLKDLENTMTSESFWFKISLNGKDHFVGSWYREPSAPVDHMKLLKEQLGGIIAKAKKNILPNIHVLVDFNFS